MQEDILMLWLSCVLGLNRKKIHRLLAYFPQISDSMNASKEILTEELRLTAEEAGAILSRRKIEDAEARYYRYQDEGILYYAIQNPNYPTLLRDISDPPCGLFVRGQFPKESLPRVSVIGARICTDIGAQTAYNLAKDLAKQNVVVVAGMARGIDSSAHMGCLDGGGETIAVLGNGVYTCYPPENHRLMARICKQGCVISEYPPEEPVYRGNFPVRNRIIAGLSLGTVVVEATRRSGTFSTVAQALDVGREVFAVPGSILGPSHRGSNLLLQEGATIVLSSADITEPLGIRPPKLQNVTEKKEKIDLATNEKTVYDCINYAPTAIEEIAVATGLPASTLQGTLTLLELKGVIKQLPGKRYMKE